MRFVVSWAAFSVVATSASASLLDVDDATARAKARSSTFNGPLYLMMQANDTEFVDIDSKDGLAEELDKDEEDASNTTMAIDLWRHLEGVFYDGTGNCCNHNACVLGPCMKIQSQAQCKNVKPILKLHYNPPGEITFTPSSEADTGCVFKEGSLTWGGEATPAMAEHGNVCGCYAELTHGVRLKKAAKKILKNLKNLKVPKFRQILTEDEIKSITDELESKDKSLEDKQNVLLSEGHQSALNVKAFIVNEEDAKKFLDKLMERQELKDETGHKIPLTVGGLMAIGHDVKTDRDESVKRMKRAYDDQGQPIFLDDPNEEVSEVNIGQLQSLKTFDTEIKQFKTQAAKDVSLAQDFFWREEDPKKSCKDAATEGGFVCPQGTEAKPVETLTDCKRGLFKYHLIHTLADDPRGKDIDVNKPFPGGPFGREITGTKVTVLDVGVLSGKYHKRRGCFFRELDQSKAAFLTFVTFDGNHCMSSLGEECSSDLCGCYTNA